MLSSRDHTLSSKKWRTERAGVFVAAHGLSLVVASRGYSLLRCMGFSLQEEMASLIAENGL